MVAFANPNMFAGPHNDHYSKWQGNWANDLKQHKIQQNVKRGGADTRGHECDPFVELDKIPKILLDPFIILKQ